VKDSDRLLVPQQTLIFWGWKCHVLCYCCVLSVPQLTLEWTLRVSQDLGNMLGRIASRCWHATSRLRLGVGEHIIRKHLIEVSVVRSLCWSKWMSCLLLTGARNTHNEWQAIARLNRSYCNGQTTKDITSSQAGRVAYPCVSLRSCQ
jgi:hypothetical protein